MRARLGRRSPRRRTRRQTGALLAKRRITDDAAGYRLLLELLAEHGDTPQRPIPVAIETIHGLLVATLRTGSRQICAGNPLSVARYRDRHAVSRKKSDHGDALVLANILRTDMAAHRPLPRDTDLARAITILAAPAGRGHGSWPTRSAHCCETTARPRRMPSSASRTDSFGRIHASSSQQRPRHQAGRRN